MLHWVTNTRYSYREWIGHHYVLSFQTFFCSGWADRQRETQAHRDRQRETKNKRSFVRGGGWVGWADRQTETETETDKEQTLLCSGWR